MPQEVIDQVNTLGKKDGVLTQLIFFDYKGTPVKPSETQFQANVLADDHDEIAGVPQEPDLPNNVKWYDPNVDVPTQPDVESPTTESEHAPEK